MSSQTSVPPLTRPADNGSPVLPLSLPHPVTALVTNRPDDLAVVDAAVRPAWTWSSAACASPSPCARAAAPLSAGPPEPGR